MVSLQASSSSELLLMIVDPSAYSLSCFLALSVVTTFEFLLLRYETALVFLGNGEAWPSPLGFEASLFNLIVTI